MQHRFDVEVAVKVGVLPAVIAENIRFWCVNKHAEGDVDEDGRPWFKNTAEEFAVIYPYATENQVRRALKVLVTHGVLIAEKRNRNGYDHTMSYSYALTDWTGEIPNNDGFCKSAKSILQKSENDLADLQNRSGKKAKSIRQKRENIKEAIETSNINTIAQDDPASAISRLRNVLASSADHRAFDQLARETVEVTEDRIFVRSRWTKDRSENDLYSPLRAIGVTVELLQVEPAKAVRVK